MAINKELILKLRDLSQAGFSDCKKALEENNNDIEESIKWLRSRGISKASNKNLNKEAKEGGTWVGKDDKGVVIIEINSETDFTANSEQFVKLAEGIVALALEKKINDIQKFGLEVMPNGGTVNDSCLHLSSIVGEKIVLSRLQYCGISDSESVSCYRHNNGKMSTFIVFEGKKPDDQINGFAVHMAAFNPKFVSKNDVDSKWIESEKQIISDLLKKENKPEQFHAKIIEERIKKIIAQDTFLEQDYMYDNSVTVGKKLEQLGLTIKKAVYFGLGGI